MQKVRSNFFSSVAHELRTPLNSIIPLLKMILDIYGECLSSPHAKELIRVVLNSALHLQNVIEDALDVSRLENNKFQLFKDYFSISDAVKDVCEIMEFQFRQKKLQLILNMKERVPHTVFSDIKRFKQVLFNLLGNAVKFTFKGQVTLSLDFDELSKMLLVDVEDTGVGIMPEDLSRLFKFFSCILRTKDCNRGGMGLGLTISKMIVQELGGEFNVSSSYGFGSKFSFTLFMDHFEYKAVDDGNRSLDDHDIG